MKVRKVKQMLIAALVACAGILVSNAAAVASAEKEFALLPPVMLTGLSATPIANGQTLADSTISGTATAVDFGDVAGTFAWDSPTTAPSASDRQTTAYAVTFTPADPNHSKTGATTLKLPPIVAGGEKEFALLPPVILTGLSATMVTNGQTLADSTISGTATAIDFGDVAGTFTWDSPATVPIVTDGQPTAYAVTFTPTNPNHSKTGTTTLRLPAVACGAKEFALLPPVTLSNLSATSITYGQTLADSTITGTATTADFGDVVGTFTWDSPATVPGLSDSQTTAYAVTFTPTDPNHSKTGATTLTLTVEINERQKAIEETFPAPTYAVTGPDEEGVYTVTLQDDVTGPVRIPDNLGKVQIDLNGHTITGPNGETGGATEAGTSGQSAIIVYHDTEKSGDATELAIVDGNPDETADIVGGDGGDGNTPGDGAPAIKIDDDVQTGVTLVVGEQVDIQGGKGGNALGVDADGNGVPGGDGGAGVDGDVKTNNGTITGGDGGAGSDGGDVGGNGGNGGDGVTGTEGEDGTGTTVGGNGGKGGDGDDKGGQGGDGGAGDPAGQKGAGGKTAAQKALEEAFEPNAYVEPMTNAEGQVTNYNVVVTNDITGPVVVPENVDKFVIDLNGKDITGADGTTGGEGIPGGEGTSAIVVSNAEAQVSVVGPGSITGGNGGAGNPPGEGAEAIVTSEGAKVVPAVSGDATVSKGSDGTDLKSDEQKALEEAFEPNAVVTPVTDDDGNVTNYNVTVTNDITGPVVVNEPATNFVIDVNGHKIAGTNGVDGTSATAGTEGGPAIVVPDDAKVIVTDSDPNETSGIFGGDGGAGNPAGKGAEAIVTSDGEAAEPTVIAPAVVSKGAEGVLVQPLSVTIDEVLTRTPWNGDIEVRYTCTDLRAGFGYKEVFHVTVSGVERIVTNAVPTLDVGYASLSKSYVIRGEALFGANVRDNKAKVYVELVPVPSAE